MATPQPFTTGSTPPPPRSLATLATTLLVGGVAAIVFAAIHFADVVVSSSNPTAPYDAAFNLALGLLLIAASRLLRARRSAVVALLVAAVVGSVAYTFLVGRGLNVIFLVVGALVLWQVMDFRRKGYLKGSVSDKRLS